MYYPWRQYLQMTDEQLERIDVALMNLACTEGLPDAAHVDHEFCLSRIRSDAARVKEYTDHCFPKFRTDPGKYRNSEAYFGALCLITVLQRDLGVRYNPAKASEDVPFDSADTFIHGIYQGGGGTCATMPVVYAAVGRRLGYPIRLASCRGPKFGHCFARWDDPSGERFNIEATNKGLSTPPDDFYRTGQFEISPEVEAAGGYLLSKTASHELASFLALRGMRWLDYGKHRLAAEALAWAAALVPHLRMYLDTLQSCLRGWEKELEKRKPPNFPPLVLNWDTRRFPDTLPHNREHGVLGLEATENALNDPRLEGEFWGPMRRGLQMERRVVKLNAHFPWNGGCEIGVQWTRAEALAN